MDNPVWVAEVGVLDAECYADGTDTTISLHQTRETALREVEAMLKRAKVGGLTDEQIATLVADNAGDYNSNGGVAHATFNTSVAEHYGWTNDEDQFEWSWAVYPRSVKP